MKSLQEPGRLVATSQTVCPGQFPLGSIESRAAARAMALAKVRRQESLLVRVTGHCQVGGGEQRVRSKPRFASLADVTDVITDLAGVRAQRNSRDFVAHLRGIGQNHPLARSLQQAFDANRDNGERFRSGQLDADFLRRMEKRNIRTLLPERTPAGLIIPDDRKTEFLDRSPLNDFPD